MVTESSSNRFQRFGKVPTLDDVLKDCRDLEQEVLALREKMDAMQSVIDSLQKKLGE